MIVAKELRKKNIIEYLLYMWHIEEIIRAHNFNFFDIEKSVVERYNQSQEMVSEIRNWYRQLVNQMINEDLQDGGHFKYLNEIMLELNDLHIELLNTLQEEKYISLYHLAQPVLHDLRQKAHKENITEMELCLNGLYGIMLLRIQGKTIGAETTEAINVISRMMGYLATNYHKRKA
jgi:hypothetical protein